MVKRKAAANIFLQQNIGTDEAMQQMEDRADLPSAESAIAPAPAMYKGPSSPQPLMAKEENRTEQKKKPPLIATGIKSSEEMQLEKEPIQVRETGAFFWRRIIVPPNAYVVHTRIRRKEPVTLGLGISFRFNPRTDAYLVIPAAMQTIGVVANCISKEKQGINILAYVQWQIHDFAIAYKKLDFSDRRDPLGIVNAQLREQAEAAIKDKISTMSVEEVLTDKAPIIEELTARLREVTEGRSGAAGKAEQEGLGIKIVTVQIREAIVSSQSLWSNLQSPFRHEKEKTARISYLNMVQEINHRELETEKETERRKTETKVEIESLKQRKETEAQDIRLKEQALRFQKEQQDKQNRLLMVEATNIAEIESEQRTQIRQQEITQERELAIKTMAEEQKLKEVELQLKTEKEIAELEALKLRQEMQLRAETERLELDLETERNQRLMAMEKMQGELQQIKTELALLLRSKELEAELTFTRRTEENRLSMQSAMEEQRIRFEKAGTEISRLQQEIRNLSNFKDIAGRLVERLPEIAREMPEIKEIKIFQNSSSSVDTSDHLVQFIQKLFFFLQDLGKSIEKKTDSSN